MKNNKYSTLKPILYTQMQIAFILLIYLSVAVHTLVAMLYNEQSFKYFLNVLSVKKVVPFI